MRVATLLLSAGLLCLLQVGCITSAHHAVSAIDLPLDFQAPRREALKPVNLALLRQEPPKEYLLGEGDVVGVYVPTVLPATPAGNPAIVPLIPPAGLLSRDVYPPTGFANVPNTGVPLTLGKDGVLLLPRIEPLNLVNATLTEAATMVRDAYHKSGILAEGQAVSVTLIKPRVQRVLVLREDTGAELPMLIAKSQAVYTRSGRGDVVDLPAFENDVLHALAATGGLPGLESFNHVWVLKSEFVDPKQREKQLAEQDFVTDQDAAAAFRALDVSHRAVRIPLRADPCEPLPFAPADILLHTGDVIYLEPRDKEVFYTGGLLPGGEVPLPRDRDIDVLEAIAIANGSLGGFGGVSANVFRAGAGPGNVIPPTRAVIIRKLPQGGQVLIKVDLNCARLDPRERVIIQPGDFVMMHYKPHEIAGNVALNFFNFTYLISPAN
jgi:protein involved in polysaccharide export with SLBB domain